MKIIPTPFLAALIVLLSVGFYFDREDFFPNGVFFLLMLFAALVFFGWHSMRIKFASIDSNNLYASGFFKSVIIPLTNIQYIHYSPGVGLVIVRLKSPSAFGSTICFMPTWANAMLALFRQRSIVEELREMVNAARPVNAI